MSDRNTVLRLVLLIVVSVNLGMTLQRVITDHTARPSVQVYVQCEPDRYCKATP